MDSPARTAAGPRVPRPGAVSALPPGYSEWPAPAGLRHAIACLWAQVIPDGGDREGLVLPDACTDLIWEQGRGALVAGPDTGPVRTVMTGGTVILGVRFRPSAGGPALGVPLSELRNQRVNLVDLRRAGAARLPGTLGPDAAMARALEVAAGLVADGEPDPAVTWATALLSDPRARTEDVAAEIGLSLRQLRRRCHAAVGYGPKTLQRVLRFRRFVSRVDEGGPAARDLAVVAAEAGYADQAHLTRECGRLSGLTPAALARQRASLQQDRVDRAVEGEERFEQEVVAQTSSFEVASVAGRAPHRPVAATPSRTLR